MPAETLHHFYSRRPRGNRRRPKHPVLWACARVVLEIVAVCILIALMIKLGFFQESEHTVYVATGFAL